MYHHPWHGEVSGLYKIDTFYVNNRLQQPLNNDSSRWKKLAINYYFPIAAVQLASDSITEYAFSTDAVKKIIDLNSLKNPKVNMQLYYSSNNSGEWIFHGIIKNDTIRFTAKKINPGFNLEKGYGKIIWDFDF